MQKLTEVQFTPELIEQIDSCATPEELLQLAKEHDIELNLEEAQQVLANLANADLDDETMENIAGGRICDLTCPDHHCSNHHCPGK